MGRPLRIGRVVLREDDRADEHRFRGAQPGAHDRDGDGPCCVDAQTRFTVRR